MVLRYWRRTWTSAVRATVAPKKSYASCSAPPWSSARSSPSSASPARATPSTSRQKLGSSRSSKRTNRAPALRVLSSFYKFVIHLSVNNLSMNEYCSVEKRPCSVECLLVISTSMFVSSCRQENLVIIFFPKGCVIAPGRFAA